MEYTLGKLSHLSHLLSLVYESAKIDQLESVLDIVYVVNESSSERLLAIFRFVVLYCVLPSSPSPHLHMQNSAFALHMVYFLRYMPLRVKRILSHLNFEFKIFNDATVCHRFSDCSRALINAQFVTFIVKRNKTSKNVAKSDDIIAISRLAKHACNWHSNQVQINESGARI